MRRDESEGVRGNPATDEWRTAFKAAGRKLKHRIVDPLLLKFGYELWRAVPEWESRPTSPRESEKLLELSAKTIWAVIGWKLGADKERIRHEVERFFEVISSCPVVQSHGGSGVNGALLLFVIARVLNPDVIIESGVFRGFTTWILRMACPAAEIYCFDLSFRSLMYRDENAIYVEHDWSEFELAVPGLKRSLCFFDDHVDQWRRIEEAKCRKIDYAIFDDSFPAHAIHCELSLAVPSAAFLLEESLFEGGKIEWRKGKLNLVYEIDVDRATNVKSLCKNIIQLPSLVDQTGYRPASMTWIEIA